MLPSVSPISCFNRLNERRTVPRQKYAGGHARPVLQQRIETVECFPPEDVAHGEKKADPAERPVEVHGGYATSCAGVPGPTADQATSRPFLRGRMSTWTPQR